MKMLRTALVIAKLNFCKWRSKPQIISIFLIQFAFSINHLNGLGQFAENAEQRLCPWVFPFFLSPMVLVFFCSLITFLFSDAPFVDADYSFVVLRCGKRVWLLGQLFYVGFVSLLFSVVVISASVLVLLPEATFSSDWGVVLRSLAESPQLADAYGVSDYVLRIYKNLILTFTPGQAMLLSFLLLWLVSMLAGVLMLWCGVFLNSLCGIAASAFFTVLSYFSYYQGAFSLGTWLSFLSPYSWASMLRVDWYSSGGPSATWCFGWLLCLITLMSLHILWRGYRRD